MQLESVVQGQWLIHEGQATKQLNLPPLLLDDPDAVYSIRAFVIENLDGI